MSQPHAELNLNGIKYNRYGYLILADGKYADESYDCIRFNNKVFHYRHIVVRFEERLKRDVIIAVDRNWMKIIPVGRRVIFIHGDFSKTTHVKLSVFNNQFRKYTTEEAYEILTKMLTPVGIKNPKWPSDIALACVDNDDAIEF